MAGNSKTKNGHSKKLSFFQRHNVATAITVVCISIFVGVYLAWSTPSPARLINQVIADRRRQINDPNWLEYINENATFTIKANPDFNNLKVGDVTDWLGGVAWGESIGHAPECELLLTDEVPNQYDPRIKYSDCFYESFPLFPQKTCSTSWAVATTDVISNRLCIDDSHTFAGLRMSPQSLLSCFPAAAGTCAGGGLEWPAVYAMQLGLVSTFCFPYEGDSRVSCAARCPHEDPTKISGFCKPTDVKREIYENGPVATSIILYDDFLNYAGGIYEPIKDRSKPLMKSGGLVTHGVSLIGWGPDYWIIQTNFGPNWGEDGGYARVSNKMIILTNNVIARK